MRHSVIPISNGQGPVFRNIADSQEEGLKDRFIIWKHSLIFSDFTQLAIDRFNGIGGVNNLSYFRRVLQKDS